MKKFLSIVLSLAMILSTMSTVVFADATAVDVAVGDGQTYATWSDAINNAADIDGDGEITYGVYGKVVMDALDVKGDGNVTIVNVIGMDDDAELEVVKGDSEWSVITVSDTAVTEMNFYDITLTRDGGANIYDAGHHNTVFTVWLRYSDAGNQGLVTYTDCVFPGGSGNNQYGITAYEGCTFNNPSYYALWIYSSAQAGTTVVTVDECEFAADRGVKIYSEDGTNTAVAETTISNSVFDIASKPAIVSSTKGTLAIEEVDATDCRYGLLATEYKDHNSNYSLAEVTVDGEAPEYVASYRGELYTNYDYALSEAKGDTTVVEAVVAEVDGEYFTDMAAAIKAIANDSNVVIFAGTYNNALSISKNNVTVTANGDVTFTAAPSIKGKNYYVEGINFEYDNGKTNLGGSGLIENCNFTAGNNTFRYCYADEGTIEFNGCTLNATNWAIHFDSAPGLNLVLVDSSITGRIALGSDLNSFSATGTDFNNEYINIWGTVDGATFDECEFNDIPYIFTGYDEDNTVEFTDCTTDDGSSIADLIYGDIEDTNTTIIVDGASKTKAAKIGDVYYKTLAEALDAIGTVAGDYTINLIADSDEDVIINQTEGVNITIKGSDDVKYTGSMEIYGQARATGAETLTIDGVYFDGAAKTADHDFIHSNKTTSEARYAHNVTVQNCHFEGSNNADVVGLRIRQGYSIEILNCTANNVHSVMWGTGIGGDGVTVDNLTANSTSGGISLGGATVSTVVTNSNITVTGEYGYGIRTDANGNYDLAINNTIINAFTPVLLRKATSSDYTMTSTNNTFTASNPMGMDVVTTKTDYDEKNPEVIAPDVDLDLDLGLANEIEVVFEKVAENDEASDLYNINLVGANAEIINRLNSGDLTFVFDPEDGKDVDFEILDADKNDHITIAPVDNSKYRYEFHFDTKANVADTANTITIAQVKFEGYGKFSFMVDEAATTNVVHATKLVDSIVDTFVVGGGEGKGTLIINNAAENTDNDDSYGFIDEAEITVPTRTLTINIDFPNAVENNVAAYQDMTVTIVGGTVDEEIKLGTDEEAYSFERVLPYNTPYTVTVKGAGYRTARYTVTLNDNKTLNFWNNVKDIENAKAIEDKGTVKVTKNFLAGDIVKDNNINIYDLSAVVSYFNTNTNTTAKDDNAKYDLNRDGVINSKDVAYVLVSWGE